MQANSSTRAPQSHDVDGESSALLYRPALLVVYASLIATYLAMRFVAFAGQWPTRQDLQLAITSAAVGAALLIFSSFTIAMAKYALRSSRESFARLWLLLTLLLGTGFGFLQANEYQRRWQSNLVPKPLSNSLHDRADLYFLSAVQQRLIQLATQINSDKVRQNQLAQLLQSSAETLRDNRAKLEAELKGLQAAEPERAERLTIVNRLLANEARWTSSVVATADDLTKQRMAMAALAYDILPHRTHEPSHQQFRQYESKQLEDLQTTIKVNLLAAETSAQENSQPIKELLSVVAKLKDEQQELESQLKSHLRQRIIDEDQDEPPPDEDPKRTELERQIAEISQRLEEPNAKLTAAAKLVTEAEDTASRLSEELRNIKARQSTIVEIDSVGVGLNQVYPWLRLPVCIPGGTAWAWMYFVLTAVHAMHLIYVLIVVVVWAMLPRLVNFSKVASNVRNWHTMVIVWCILFVLIYLI